MVYSYKVFRSATTVDQAGWERLCRGQQDELLMDIRFLSTVERTLAGTSNLWYIMVYDGNSQPVACACISTMKTDATILAKGLLSSSVGLVRKAFPSFCYLNILYCGLPVSLGQSSIRFADGADRDALLHLIDNIINDIGSEQHVDIIVYKEFDERGRREMAALDKLGYFCVESLYMHYFKPIAGDFAGYCQTLKSHYRRLTLLSVKKFNKSGCTAVTLNAPEAIAAVYTPEVHRLYEAVSARAEHRLEIRPAAFFLKLSKLFPGQVRLTAAYRGDRIIGTSWSISSDTKYYWIGCGIDYSENKETDTYFNLIFHELDLALSQNVRVIHMGQTADRFKARIGCYHSPRCFFVKGAKSYLHAGLRLFANRLFPPVDPPPCHNIFSSRNAARSTGVHAPER